MKRPKVYLYKPCRLHDFMLLAIAAMEDAGQTEKAMEMCYRIIKNETEEPEVIRSIFNEYVQVIYRFRYGEA